MLTVQAERGLVATRVRMSEHIPRHLMADYVHYLEGRRLPFDHRAFVCTHAIFIHCSVDRLSLQAIAPILPETTACIVGAPAAVHLSTSP